MTTILSNLCAFECSILMEEEEGFEPPRGLTRLSVFKTDPFSQTWVFLQMYKVDLVGIEPTTFRV